MPTLLFDWPRRGFAHAPQLRVSDGHLLLYRCWGARAPGVGSSEVGSGFFSLEKPTSVQDAELRFNVVDWNNGIRFVSTFRLAQGWDYWAGPVAHRDGDLRRPGTQVYVETRRDGPVAHRDGDLRRPKTQIHVETLAARGLTLVRSKEVLRHDVAVSSVDGHA